MNKKQLFISMTAQIVSFAVSMGVSFILSPYLAKAIDISASGFVTQGNQFVSYAQILVSALNTMASRFITVSIHQGREEEANRYFSMMVLVTLLLGGRIREVRLGAAASVLCGGLRHGELAAVAFGGVGLPLVLPLFWGLDGIMFFMPGADILTGIAAVIVIVRICRDLNGPEEEEVRHE